MPPKSQRTKTTNNFGSASQVGSSPSLNNIKADACAESSDYSKMSSFDLVNYIKVLNKDPNIDRVLNVLAQKLQNGVLDDIEAEKRSRTIVISGVEEPPNGLRPTERAADLKKKVDDLLDVLEIDCPVHDIFRVGKSNGSRPPLVKVVFPSKFYWRKALSNSPKLRRAGFNNIYIRKSMTADERQHEYELRRQARERNAGKPTREWVVFRGELKHVSELPRRHPENLSGNY